MTLPDPRKGYLSRISLSESSVNLTPYIVFLFDGDRNNAGTVRGYLYNHILANKRSLSKSLVIPEEFKDWLHDSVYPDLLTFEQDLAHTASLIVIALESPGATAELGCFSVNSSLRHKLMIILSEEHHAEPSFIRLGPLRQIGDESLYAYPYVYNNISNTLPPFVGDITDSIESRLDGQGKTIKFDTSSSGHIAFLIFDLVSIFKALKLKEIQEFLGCLDIDITSSAVKRILFLLTKLDMVTTRRAGNLDYYIPRRDQVRVHFSSKDKKARFDRGMASIGAMEYYSRNSKESLRKRLIEDSLHGGVAE